MNDNEIRNAFEKMAETVHPERVEDAVRERLSAKEKRRRIRFPRAVVAAACVLALTALSVGAYGVYRNVAIYLTEEEGPYSYEVQINFGEDRIALSEEVMEELAQYDTRQINMEEGRGVYDIGKMFDSWEEAEEWLGCDLLNSNCFGDTHEDVSICLRSVYYEDELTSVHLTGVNSLVDMEYSCCNISIQIPVSGQIPGIVFGGGSYTVEYSGTDEIIPYTAENGLSADIILTERTNGYSTSYNARIYLYHGGIVYEYHLFNPDKDTAVTYMKQILDSLQ